MLANPQEGQTRVRQALSALAERRWTIVLVTLATVAGAAALAFTTERSYTATADVLVKKTVAETARDDELNLETERRVATSYEVVSRAAPDLGLDEDEARSRLSVSNVPGTEILVMAFSDDDAAAAQRGAERFAQAYLDNRHAQALAEVEAVAASIEEQVESLEAELARRTRAVTTAPSAAQRSAARAEADVVLAQIAAAQSDLAALAPPSPLEVGRIVQPAELPEDQSGPGPAPTLILALLLGLALGVGAALFRERLDQRVRDRVPVEALTGAPVLATVPPLGRRQRRRGAPPVVLADPDGAPAEAYRILRARLTPALEDGRVRTILVTSPHPGDGKSLTAANLGVVFAQADRRTVVVSADLRRPALHHVINARPEPGLSSLLAPGATPGTHLNTVPTGVRNLVFLPSGPLPSNPAELIGSGTMAELLQRLRQTAEIVVLDSPSLLSVADASVLAAAVDAVVLVADARTTTRTHLADAAHALRQVNANLIGTVLVNFEVGSVTGYAAEAAPAG